MRSLFCLLLLAILSGPARGQAPQPAAVFSSGERQTPLVELYTSEGCSSCPPADRWLSGLKRDGALWRDYVPVAFHVDYWNYLGWTDRFADADHSARQRRYAREGGVRTVYTPGMFLNGLEWAGWRRVDVPNAAGMPGPGVLRLELAGRQLDITFDADTISANEGLAVTVALLGMNIDSSITAGENRGHRLDHDFVVLGTRQLPMERSGRRHTARLALPQAKAPAPGYAIAAWVAADGMQAPLQAAGGFLPAENAPAEARPGRR